MPRFLVHFFLFPLAPTRWISAKECVKGFAKKRPGQMDDGIPEEIFPLANDLAGHRSMFLRQTESETQQAVIVV